MSDETEIRCHFKLRHRWNNKPLVLHETGPFPYDLDDANSRLSALVRARKALADPYLPGLRADWKIVDVCIQTTEIE